MKFILKLLVICLAITNLAFASSTKKEVILLEGDTFKASYYLHLENLPADKHYVVTCDLRSLNNANPEIRLSIYRNDLTLAFIDHKWISYHEAVPFNSKGSKLRIFNLTNFSGHVAFTHPGLGEVELANCRAEKLI